MKYIKYKEIKQRGTFDFPLEFHHVQPNHPRYAMPYHWHSEYELIRILKGTFSIVLNGQETLAEAGDILFIHDGTLHGGNPSECIYECIVFDMKMLLKENMSCQKYMQDIMNHDTIIHNIFPKEITRLNDTICHLFQTIQKKTPGYEMIIQGCLYEILGLIIEHHLYFKNNSTTIKNTQHIHQLKKALSLIETSYADCITLENLSKAAGMSPKYFCRFFQEMTLKTPIDYLNFYRIECACYQLVTTDQSITDIALNCGFNDISYFIKTFKKYKGITPKKYLKEPFEHNAI